MISSGTIFALIQILTINSSISHSATHFSNLAAAILLRL